MGKPMSIGTTVSQITFCKNNIGFNKIACTYRLGAVQAFRDSEARNPLTKERQREKLEATKFY